MTYGTYTNRTTAINRIVKQREEAIARQKRIENRLIWAINIMMAGFLIAGHLMQRSF